MVKLSGSSADTFMQRPDPAIRAVLIYGPDEGQVRERCNRLTQTRCPDLSDPFRIADLTGAMVKDDPARVADECAAIAFGGGQRVVRVSALADNQAQSVLRFLMHPVGDALLIVTATTLPPKSKLRSAFETAKNAVAIACYPLEGAQLSSAIRQAFIGQNLQPDNDAVEMLAALLADDSACMRSEIEKIRLYIGADNHPVTREDVHACCGDQSERSVFELAFAVGDGNHKAVQTICDRLLASGENAVAIVRGVARHFDRLFQARAAMDAGEAADAAMKQLRPPVFFKDVTPFRRQLTGWPASALMMALDRLLDVERQCKTTGMPTIVMTQRGLLEVTALAARLRRSG